MGACTSTYSVNVDTFGADEYGQASRVAHQMAEREIKDTKRQLTQVSKVLLLGSGDSGKSTILKQMRIINSVPWTSQEVETYRLQIFLNLVQGMRLLLDCLKDMSENPPLSRSLSAVLLPPSYVTPPQSSHHHQRSPSSVTAHAFFNRRQRSESLSSNASTMMTIHTGTTLDGIPSQIPSLPRRKLTYSARHAELHARLDGVPDLREGDPFPQNVGSILMELWGVEIGREWAGGRNFSATDANGVQAEPVVEIDAKGTSVGQNDLRECVERAKVGGNLPDNLEYFFSQLPRLFESDYIPSEQDILHCRIRTTGINETVFKLKKPSKNPLQLHAASCAAPIPPDSGKTPAPESRRSIGAASAVAIAGFSQAVGRSIRTESGAGQGPEPEVEKKVRPLAGFGVTLLHVIDVGGQRSERRKWIHCFEDVTTLLFLVSLSGYCQSLVEDVHANQMQDAMAMWDGICSSQWFRFTPIILFLNKEDLFRARVPIAHIKSTFPDYEGAPGDVEAGKEYFLKRFLRLAAKGARARPTTAQTNAPKGKTGFIGTLHGDRGVRHGGGSGPERSNVGGRVMKEPGGRANAGRNVYHHFTNATDTTMLRVVMSAVMDIIIRDNFARAYII